MITRIDNLSYIGITTNPDKRFKDHEKSIRFEAGIKDIKILEICDTYELAEEREEYYITFYNTFNNGLNITEDGKGYNKNCKFNTVGHKHSDKSKKKMSISAKKRGCAHIKKYWANITDEEKSIIRQKQMQTRKGNHYPSVFKKPNLGINNPYLLD
jgi:N-glycosylase/DNA lyase